MNKYAMNKYVMNKYVMNKCMVLLKISSIKAHFLMIRREFFGTMLKRSSELHNFIQRSLPARCVWKFAMVRISETGLYWKYDRTFFVGQSTKVMQTIQQKKQTNCGLVNLVPICGKLLEKVFLSTMIST